MASSFVPDWQKPIIDPHFFISFSTIQLSLRTVQVATILFPGHNPLLKLYPLFFLVRQAISILHCLRQTTQHLYCLMAAVRKGQGTKLWFVLLFMLQVISWGHNPQILRGEETVGLYVWVQRILLITGKNARNLHLTRISFAETLVCCFL